MRSYFTNPKLKQNYAIILIVSKEAVIFDYNRTLVQGDEFPPQFYPEAPAVLESLRTKGIKMAIVSVSEDPTSRMQEFKKLGLPRYISVFKIVGKGDRKDLQPVLDELQVDPEHCVVVGDRIKKEIFEGNKVGATTIWLRQGKFSDEIPEIPEEEPTYTIYSLEELIPVFDSLA